MEEFSCKILRSRRKTLSIQVKNLEILVRAPYDVPKGEIEAFVRRHRAWIERQFEKQAAREAEEAKTVKFSKEEIEAIRKRAKQLIPDRAALYADRIGVTCRSITRRFQHSRWGSCSANGNLSFNCLLILAPAEVLDSVIVHELCHRKEMNHSPRFYAEVVRVFPEYRKWNKWLKEHGRTLLNRLP